MKRTNKKGFTIVELVVVIAIIAILAAVLIPTFASLIKRANVSKDNQLVRNLNTALAADAALNGKHETMYSALKAAEDAGYIVERINASAKGNEILWDSVNDVFCYRDGNIQYIPEAPKKKDVEPYQYWVISDTLNTTYSTYYIGDEAAVTVSTGFDAGDKVLTSIKYENTATTAKDVVIRTNSANTTLTVNGYVDPSDNTKGDVVYHYGSAGALEIKKCATGSYHENGKVAFAEIAKGRIVLESGSKIDHIHINKKDSNTFDTVVIKDNGAEALPTAITRDEVTVTDASGKTEVVTVESSAGTETVYVYGAGTTQKITTGDNKQNENVDTALGSLVLDNGIAGEKALSADEKTEAQTGVVENAQAQELVGDFWISLASDSFASGTGTESDPYIITNATQLSRLAKLVMEENESVYATKYYKLNNNIDLSGKAWTPIGTEAHPFKGHFDGNDKVITGLTNNGKGKNDLNLSSRAFSSGGYGSSYGLFGHVSNTTIKNVCIEKSEINSVDFSEAGFVVGACKNSITLINCSVDSESLFVGLKKVGGIIGYIEFDKNGIDDEGNTVLISGCTFSGSIKATASSNDRPSGILAAICADSNAFNNTISISNCVVNGTITSTDYYGAFIAHIYNMRNTTVTIENCSTVNNYYAIGYLSNGYVQNISTTGMTDAQKEKLKNMTVSFKNCIKNDNESNKVFYSEFNEAIKKTDPCDYSDNPFSLYQWLNSGKDITFTNNNTND